MAYTLINMSYTLINMVIKPIAMIAIGEGFYCSTVAIVKIAPLINMVMMSCSYVHDCVILDMDHTFSFFCLHGKEFNYQYKLYLKHGDDIKIKLQTHWLAPYPDNPMLCQLGSLALQDWCQFLSLYGNNCYYQHLHGQHPTCPRSCTFFNV